MSGSDNMEREERLTTFIESMKNDQPFYLEKLQEKALSEGIPIIRPQTRGLIRFLMEVSKPRNILEIGTAVGYSALFMHDSAPAGAKILTVEKDAARAAEAERNFAEAGVNADGTAIRLIVGDAGEILPQLQESFDFIFMDGPKAQYIVYLPEIRRLLAPGGILLSDNILKDGEILESRYAIARRDRTIHARMREYLEALQTDPGFRTVILGTGDGAAVSVKRNGQATAGEKDRDR
jgi:predicted O-methyltransferase YrrM